MQTTQTLLEEMTLSIQAAHLAPRTYLELLGVLADSRAGLEDVAQVVERDVGLAAHILRLANSASLGFGRPVTSVGRAVTQLGSQAIQDLVLSSELLRTFGPEAEQRSGLRVDAFERRQYQSARLARELLRGRRKLADLAFSAGLLKDIGELVWAAHFPQLYAMVAKCSDGRIGTKLDAERQIAGVTHAELGAFLLRLWGIPESLAAIVEHHHEPTLTSPSSFDCSWAVYIADKLFGETTATAPRIREEELAPVKSESMLPKWRELARSVIAD